MYIKLVDVGRVCQLYRKSIGCLQSTVAMETGYTVENVSAFEHGRNDNGKILLWYLLHGMPIESLRGVIDES